MRKTSDAQLRAVDKFNKEKTRIIPVRLNLSTDQDVIARLEREPSKQGYIKRLIRADIAAKE